MNQKEKREMNYHDHKWYDFFKFWKAKKFKSGHVQFTEKDLFVYTKGLQATLGLSNWCSQECDITIKFNDIKFAKFNQLLVDHKKAEKISNKKTKFKSFRDEIKQFIKG
jgi:hypothetical protein